MLSLDQMISVSGLTFPICEGRGKWGENNLFATNLSLRIWQWFCFVSFFVFDLAFQQHITLCSNSKAQVLDKVRTYK